MNKAERKIVDVIFKDFGSDFNYFTGTPDEIIQSMEKFKQSYPGRDLYFTFAPYGYDGGVELEVRERRPENDKEYKARVDFETKVKVQKEKEKKDKLAKERAEYERLKKKFGK